MSGVTPEGDTEGVWEIRGGAPRPKPLPVVPIGAVEDLDYNNPHGHTIERVWFDGHVVFATEQGELDVDPQRVKVAQEYQVVYSVHLTPDGRPEPGTEPERVAGQLNIYDSIPGMERYSPIWQFNYVVVPRDHLANTLRSERDCLESGHPIVKSRIFEN